METDGRMGRKAAGGNATCSDKFRQRAVVRAVVGGGGGAHACVCTTQSVRGASNAIAPAHQQGWLPASPVRPSLHSASRECCLHSGPTVQIKFSFRPSETLALIPPKGGEGCTQDNGCMQDDGGGGRRHGWDGHEWSDHGTRLTMTVPADQPHGLPLLEVAAQSGVRGAAPALAGRAAVAVRFPHIVTQ